MERAGESMVGLSPPSATMFSMARLFVAVWPSADVIEALCALRRKDERGVRFVRPENWHITLRFLGETHPADVIERHGVLGGEVEFLAKPFSSASLLHRVREVLDARRRTTIAS